VGEKEKERESAHLGGSDAIVCHLGVRNIIEHNDTVCRARSVDVRAELRWNRGCKLELGELVDMSKLQKRELRYECNRQKNRASLPR
jgi:hypothetical protein